MSRQLEQGTQPNPASYGPDWEKAIAFGLDVSLLLENLELTPTERLARLQQVVEFHAVAKCPNSQPLSWRASRLLCVAGEDSALTGSQVPSAGFGLAAHEQ